MVSCANPVWDWLHSGPPVCCLPPLGDLQHGLMACCLLWPLGNLKHFYFTITITTICTKVKPNSYSANNSVQYLGFIHNLFGFFFFERFGLGLTLSSMYKAYLLDLSLLHFTVAGASGITCYRHLSLKLLGFQRKSWTLFGTLALPYVCKPQLFPMVPSCL